MVYIKYRREIGEILGVDKLTLDVLQDEFKRISSDSLLAKHTCFFYILLSILSNCLFFLFGVKKRNKLNKDDFIFISCPDSIFRTKTINMIAHGLRYQIVYLPSFHLTAALRYARYFKKAGIKAYFPTFSIGDVLQIRKTINKLIHIIEKDSDKDTIASFRFQMETYLIYANLVDRFFPSSTSFEGKWILEHQKFFFIPLIAKLRKKNVETIMLQHGCFFKPSFNYLPLYTDKVLTCSEREKQLYIDNGVNPDRVTVFGAPLQTLSNEIGGEVEQYDLLLMMTLFETNGLLQIEILNHLKFNYPWLNVLVRMRPRSRVEDLKSLGTNIEGFVLSEPGTPISEDLSKANKVICFSEDATFEVLNAKKSFLLVGSEDSVDNTIYEKCTTKDNYKEQIKKLIETDYYSPFSKEEELYMMGERDITILHDKFVSFIRS